MCSTFTLFPLGFGAVALAGLGFGNRAVVLLGSVIGLGQNVDDRELQICRPSQPPTSANLSTCVHTEPKVEASKFSSQVSLL